MKIDELKVGQKFKMQWGYSTWIAKCVINDTVNKVIVFELYCFFGLFKFGIMDERRYSDYNFKYFEYYNG